MKVLVFIAESLRILSMTRECSDIQISFGKRVVSWGEVTDFCSLFIEELNDDEFSRLLGKSSGVRCSYCNGQGPVVACNTCNNHACVLKVRKVKGCVDLTQFGNEQFRCPGCLIDSGNDIPVCIFHPEVCGRSLTQLAIPSIQSTIILYLQLSCSKGWMEDGLAVWSMDSTWQRAK